jgi:hypothetical protein
MLGGAKILQAISNPLFLPCTPPTYVFANYNIHEIERENYFLSSFCGKITHPFLFINMIFNEIHKNTHLTESKATVGTSP